MSRRTTDHFCCIAQHSGPMPLSAVGVKGKYWEPGQDISIGFLEGTPDQLDLVRRVATTWTQFANLSFRFTDHPTEAHYSPVRIAFRAGNGSWSYIGTDCRMASAGRPTMNFGWLDEAVVLHEFGHMLGLGHEHQNPNSPIRWNKPQVYTDLGNAPNFWDHQTINHNIFARYAPGAVDTSPLDKDSIMLYQVPSRWTLDGFSAGFNTFISPTDTAFVRRIYPRPADEGTPEVATDQFRDWMAEVFVRHRDLVRLTEPVLVRMGQRLGVATHSSRLKAENIDLIVKALQITSHA